MRKNNPYYSHVVHMDTGRRLKRPRSVAIMSCGRKVLKQKWELLIFTTDPEEVTCKGCIKAMKRKRKFKEFFLKPNDDDKVAFAEAIENIAITHVPESDTQFCSCCDAESKTGCITIDHDPECIYVKAIKYLNKLDAHMAAKEGADGLRG